MGFVRYGISSVESQVGIIWDVRAPQRLELDFHSARGYENGSCHTIFGVTLARRVDQQLGGDGCAVAADDDTWS